jgi:DNA (cytosine-5)-methyltransferase 1
MPKFVDLFAGSGGLSYGLQQAGWEPILACEIWDDAVQTYRTNFGDHPVFYNDIKLLSEKALGDLLDGDPDWVVGGPPCQGFSTIGKRKANDERNGLFKEFGRVVSILRPKNFLIENVLGLRDMSFVQPVCHYFRQLGYSVSPFVVRAADFGVPQLRRRVLFVGSLDGYFFDQPSPTHTENEWISVNQAIGDLPMLLAGASAEEYSAPPFCEYQERMRKGSNTLQGHISSNHPPSLVKAISFIPDGGNRLSIPDEYQPSSGFHNSYSRLDSTKPAVAITQNMGKPSGTRCIHPFQHRGLTAREGARLQGFPDSFHFFGGTTSQRLQIANAVSPILASALASSLLNERNWCEAAA